MQSKCSQNCILIRTSSSKTNQCAPARRILCIPPQNQGKHSGTRFARPTSWLPKSRLVRLRCVYITTLEHFSERNEYQRSPRATRLCAKHRAFQNGKCGETLNTNADSVLRSNFAGGGFAKPRLIF